MIYTCSKCNKKIEYDKLKKAIICDDCLSDAFPEKFEDDIYIEYWCDKCNDIKKINLKDCNKSLFYKCNDCENEMKILELSIMNMKDEYKVRVEKITGREIRRPDFDYLINQEGLDPTKDYRKRRR